MSTEVGFVNLHRIIVPTSLADVANSHLRSVGLYGCEGFALWAGRQEGTVFQVLETLIPVQRAISGDSGVCVAVDSEELFRLNVYLHDRELSLVAQLHSHPGRAYHSDTDNAFPIATTAGALSLVVPDFAKNPFSIHGCAVYRLGPDRRWVALAAHNAEELIHLVPG